MTRSSHPVRARLLLIAAGGLLLAGVGAAPAFADYAPDGEATISVGSQYYEGGSSGFTGLCPEGTTDVVVTAEPSLGVIITPDPIVFPTDEGYFEGGWQTTNDFADPGAEILFTVTCSAETVLGTGSQAVESFDSGASISAPASVVLGEDVVVTGDCGDERAGYLAFLVTLPNGDQLFFEGTAVGEDGEWMITFPSDLLGAGDSPAQAGDVLTLTADCRDAVDTTAWYSHRVATVLVVAAPQALPATGIDAVSTLLVGAGAVAIVVVGSVLRRRARA